MIVDTETGALPLVSGAVWLVINVAIPAGTMWALTPDDEELAPGEIPPELADCVDLDPLTPGARSQALKALDTWATVAQSRYTGAAQAVAAKTVKNVRELIAKESDAEGNPVGQCHVRAGMFIVDRQFSKLDRMEGGSADPLPLVELQGKEATGEAWKLTPMKGAAIAAAAIAIGFITWRLTK